MTAARHSKTAQLYEEPTVNCCQIGASRKRNTAGTGTTSRPAAAASIGENFAAKNIGSRKSV
jgi:hypothetical protein